MPEIHSLPATDDVIAFLRDAPASIGVGRAQQLVIQALLCASSLERASDRVVTVPDASVIALVGQNGDGKIVVMLGIERSASPLGFSFRASTSPYGTGEVLTEFEWHMPDPANITLSDLGLSPETLRFLSSNTAVRTVPELLHWMRGFGKPSVFTAAMREDILAALRRHNIQYREQ